jgi:hypothetical protein
MTLVFFSKISLKTVEFYEVAKTVTLSVSIIPVYVSIHLSSYGYYGNVYTGWLCVWRTVCG